MTRPKSPDSPNCRVEGPPAEELRASVANLVNAFYQGASKQASRYGLTATEFGLLKICLEEGEGTATQLAQILPVDASRISRMVTTLVDRGLLQRRRMQSDRRIVMLSLSDEGKELTSQLLRSMSLFDDILTEGIDEDDMRVFVSVVSKIVANYSAMEGE